MNPERSKISFIKADNSLACYKAGWIVQSSGNIVENGYLEVETGRIRGVSKTRPDGKVIDLGPGVIIPCLVNAHLHLELSALKNLVNFKKGFTAWVQELLAKRENLGTELLKAAANVAAADLTGMGTGVIGEISTLGITREIVAACGLSGIWFQEVLGGVVPETQLNQSESLSFSVACHAPHTTAPEVLKALKANTLAQNLIFSIHLAESEAETQFLETGKGQWADFLASRGINIDSWPVGNTTPVQYLNKLNLLDDKTLAVHLLRVDDGDLEIIADTGTRICLCPRSNNNLHQQLPDIQSMLDKGLTPALGTDSLASCDSLNMFDEMAFIRLHYPEIRPETVLDMATVNGAATLGLGQSYGSLEPGKQSAFLYIDLDAPNKNIIFESLTNNEL